MMADQPTTKLISATDASNNFGSMIAEAARGRSLFIVTRMGKARAVVLGLEQYQDLLEELEIKQEQSDPDIQTALDEAKKDFELGRSISLDELDKEFSFTEEELTSGS